MKEEKMNEKEAREIRKRWEGYDAIHPECKAVGYLEAIEKAKGLAVYLNAFLQDTNGADFDYWDRAKYIHSKWEKEK